MTAPFFDIRPAETRDMATIAEIYAHHVLNGTGTFEEDAPDAATMTTRFEGLTAEKYPYFAAQHTETGDVLGFAYAGPFRARSAYRYTVEDSIYVHPDFQRMGIASALLRTLITVCTTAGYRQMFALIGGAGNSGSIGLHRKAGFLDAGRMVNAGYKDGRWLDVVIMQKTLGAGSQTPPE